MKKREYQDIKTLDQLNEAIRRSKQRIESQGVTVREDFEQVQQFYTPQQIAWFRAGSALNTLAK